MKREKKAYTKPVIKKNLPMQKIVFASGPVSVGGTVANPGTSQVLI
jgi:hypothetical protein